MKQRCHTDCGRTAEIEGPHGEAFCVPCAVAEAKFIEKQAKQRSRRMAIPKTRKRRQG